LVSDQVRLYHENKELTTQSNTNREELLATYAALVPFAQSCQVRDFTNLAFDSQYDDFDDLDIDFTDEDIGETSAENEQKTEDLTPYWSLRITFSNGITTHYLEKILSHQEYITHFEDKSEVVYKPFSSSTDIEFDPFKEDDGHE